MANPVLMSGTASGQGSLAIPPILLGGTASGVSTVTGDGFLTIFLGGLTSGQGFLGGHFPNPFVGTSLLVGEMLVEQAPLPVCGCKVPQPVTTFKCACGGSITLPATNVICTCSGLVPGADGIGSGGPFKWGQFFQPGDLQFFVRDSFGPVNPNSVRYTLYWIRNGIPFQAGPANRVPGHGPSVGEFYVTGRVGEGGQPGNWLVKWQYQRFFFSEINEKEFRFVVQDAVAAADPRDTTQRIYKFGWD